MATPVFFESLAEGGYNVVVPAIPEICTFGANLAEARQMAEDAIRCFLESARQRGERIPRDLARLVHPVRQELAVTVT
ncbi:MAG: type II toxin-antitoxin system HicB family antitoxin [Candidatus Methylomirabilales bacterium]